MATDTIKAGIKRPHAIIVDTAQGVSTVYLKSEADRYFDDAYLIIQRQQDELRTAGAYARSLAKDYDALKTELDNANRTISRLTAELAQLKGVVAPCETLADVIAREG